MKLIKSANLKITILILMLLNPLSVFSFEPSDFWKTLAVVKSDIIDANKPKHNIQSMVKRLEELVSEKEQLKEQNDDLKKETHSMKSEINTLYEENKKLFEELEIYKPQDLPKFQQSDITNKYFNIERIFRLRSANCFDFNGDMSCMYRVLKLDDNRTAYLVYKANRVFDTDMEIDKIVNKDGEVVSVLTVENARKIKKWEKKNPDLLILLATY